MESVVAPVIEKVSVTGARSSSSKGGVHLEYYGFDWEPLFEDPETEMHFKLRKLREDGFHIIDWQVHHDPDGSPRMWGWVVYTEGE